MRAVSIVGFLRFLVRTVSDCVVENWVPIGKEGPHLISKPILQNATFK